MQRLTWCLIVGWLLAVGETMISNLVDRKRKTETMIYDAFSALCLIVTICLVATTTTSRTTTTTTATDSSLVARDRLPGGSTETITAVADHNHRRRRYIILTPVRQQQQSLSVKSQKTLVRMRTFDQKYGKLLPYNMRKIDRYNRL